MAYINQETKKQIAAELKQIMPKHWKYSLSIEHYAELVLTIYAADISLLNDKSYEVINLYTLKSRFANDELKIMEKINEVLNSRNYDNSDVMHDYFDVGYYVELRLGKYEKPYKYIG